MEYKDYYDILGVARDASDEDIKRAYRKLARKYHPDVSTEVNAADRFKDVNEAYEVLKDPEKRQAYDQIGTQDSRDSAGFEPPPGWEGGFEFGGGGYTGGDTSGFSDFFESIFGRGGFARAQGGAGGMRGSDHTARVEIDLEDSFTGGSQTLRLRMPQVEGDRVVTRDRSIKVNIPKGVRAGQQLRLSGQGMPGAGGGPAGDLYLEIAFRPHSFYRVDGRSVSLDLPVAPWEAALGATVNTPTPGGPVELKIPPGSNNGRKLRLKGRGLPGKPAGDLLATLRIALPPQHDDNARKLYETMAEQMPFNPRKKLGV